MIFFLLFWAAQPSFFLRFLAVIGQNVRNFSACHLYTEISYVKDPFPPLITESYTVMRIGHDDRAEVTQIFPQDACLRQEIFGEKGRAVCADERTLEQSEGKGCFCRLARGFDRTGGKRLSLPFADGSMCKTVMERHFRFEYALMGEYLSFRDNGKLSCKRDKRESFRSDEQIAKLGLLGSAVCEEIGEVEKLRRASFKVELKFSLQGEGEECAAEPSLPENAERLIGAQKAAHIDCNGVFGVIESDSAGRGDKEGIVEGERYGKKFTEGVKFAEGCGGEIKLCGALEAVDETEICAPDAERAGNFR